MHDRLIHDDTQQSKLWVWQIALIDGDSQLLIRMVQGERTSESFLGTWNLTTGIYQPLETPGSLPCIRFSENGRFLVLREKNHQVSVWDRTTAKITARLPLPAEQGAVDISDDGEKLAAPNVECAVWNLATGARIWSRKNVGRCQLTPDGKKVILGKDSLGKESQVIDVETGKVICKGSGMSAFSTVSPDSRSSFYTYNNRARLYSLETGQQTECLATPFEIIGGAVSPDGRRLAAGGIFHGVRVWDIPSEDVRATWNVQDRYIRRLCFSSTGKRLATANDTGVVRLFDVDAGAELACLVLFNDVAWVTITPAGYFLGSDNLAEHARWKIDNQPVDFEQYAHQYHRPEAVSESLRSQG